MHRATLTIDPSLTLAPVNPRLYGSFVEHMGRCVYTGIYEPGHPEADEDGLRRDVLALIRELGVTMLRYPGGNYLSTARWEDGIGPGEQRKKRFDVAWRSIETNEFGLDEFIRFARKAGVEPMMAINLGTRGVEEALDLLDYANHPSDTYRSDQRAANGSPEPHNIRLWCLGNEMDGYWQPGHKTAHEYARLAAETARVMKMYDPGLELVASGSSHSGMATFGSWESTVLEETYEHVSHISCHQYYAETPDDLASFLASGVDLESFIEGVVATADAVRARGRHTKRINLSLDEWNVTFRGIDDVADTVPWQRAPRLLEDRYTATDAVVLGSLLIAMLRHADRVTAACLAQLVNVLAPILTEPGGPAWRQPTFYPFAQAARYGRGEVLRIDAVSPMESTGKYGDVPVLHTTATKESDGTVTLFAVNRGLTQPIRLAADLRALPGYQVTEHIVLSDSDPDDRLSRVNQNTLSNPDRVRPRPDKDTVVSDGMLLAVLPPVSWHVIRLGTAQRGGDQPA